MLTELAKHIMKTYNCDAYDFIWRSPNNIEIKNNLLDTTFVYHSEIYENVFLHVSKDNADIKIYVNGLNIATRNSDCDNGWYAALQPLRPQKDDILLVYDEKNHIRAAYEQVAAVEPIKKIVVINSIITSVQKFKFAFIDEIKIKTLLTEEECVYYGGFRYESAHINTGDFILRFDDRCCDSIETTGGWRHYAANEVSKFIVAYDTCEMKHGEWISSTLESLQRSEK